MGFENSTDLEQPVFEAETPERAGVIVTVLADKPHHRTVVAPKSGELTVGRTESATLPVDDDKMSRQHWSAVWNPATRRWTVYDKGSANGTIVDGERVKGSVEVGETALVRAGRSLFLLTPDAASRLTPPKLVDGLLAGAKLAAALEKIKVAASKGVPLLIIGGSGTGKEHAAATYQRASSHRNGPFVVLNCASIDRSLADARLFGAKRGSFSGADRDTPGAIAEAHRGTLFLDEVGELGLGVQAKLLRFLQSGEIHIVGEPMPRKVDVHIVSATHRNLDAMVEAGTFRNDLQARLGVRIDLPSLADRVDEIPLLADLFINDPIPRGVRLYEALMRADWSEKNIRGLQNALNTALVNAHAAKELVPEHFDAKVTRFVSAPSIAPPPPGSVAPPASAPAAPKHTTPSLLSPTDLRKAKVVAEYRANGGDIEATAAAVGLSVRRVYAILGEAGVVFRRP